MRIDILAAVPDLLQSFFFYFFIKRAQERNLLEIKVHNVHDYYKKILAKYPHSIFIIR